MDSTNVCQPVSSIITNISVDHTRQLGETVDKIAFEKAGIIKSGVPVISGAIDPEAADVLTSYGESDRNDEVDVSELAAYTMIANLLLNLDESVTRN